MTAHLDQSTVPQVLTRALRILQAGATAGAEEGAYLYRAELLVLAAVKPYCSCPGDARQGAACPAAEPPVPAYGVQVESCTCDYFQMSVFVALGSNDWRRWVDATEWGTVGNCVGKSKVKAYAPVHE